MNHINKADLVAELRDSGHDYRASVVAAELADHGIPLDNFFFRNQSTFKRAVANDIDNIFWNNGGEDGEGADYLVFDLNREGIYDMLPEAIVHSQARKRRTDEPNYKVGLELRKQEREARKFFSPLENEFHHRSLTLDRVEREMLKNNNPRRNREFFNYFFEDSSLLSDQQLVILLHILPLSHKIRGDAALIGLTITRIIGYKVEISRQWTMKTYILPPFTAPKLGDGVLGSDTVLNDIHVTPKRRFDVNIMDVPPTAYKDFTGKGTYRAILEFILPYFFPADAEYGVVLHPPKDEALLRIEEGDAFSFLGFNSYI